ncbi:MAG: aminoacetone oxidase family FAD-binding enzyme [Spirochaetales bacterium]|nr:aminoacetone oxidase family FAD-binding enzyme [Spirochaetales bacterium]
MSSSAYDLIIIGAGPAGLLAAGRAASLGSRVLILEKNRQPGKKLLISGGGRCNLTNALADVQVLAARYGKEGKKLLSVLYGFSATDCIEFFENQGVPIKIEAENRAFPGDNKSASIRDALVRFCDSPQVEIRTQTPVRDVRTTTNPGARFIVTLARGQELLSQWILIATGGFARPETGSTGDGFGWLEKLGHRVLRPEPILVPITTHETWTSALMGIAFADCGLLLENPDTSVHFRGRGKVLFTHFGLSGPLILNSSRKIDELAKSWTPKSGPMPLFLDFFPAVDGGEVERKITQVLTENPRKKISSLLANLLPPRLIDQILVQAEVEPQTQGANISKVQRKALVQGMKKFRLTYKGKLGNDKAIVSRGGVALDEVDFRTMESLRVPGLLLAGDILDFDRPSGGFSLQICWSTGWRAGETAANNKSG